MGSGKAKAVRRARRQWQEQAKTKKASDGHCGSCEYFSPIGELQDQAGNVVDVAGECRAGPPSLMFALVPAQPQQRIVGMAGAQQRTRAQWVQDTAWPRIVASQWCGAHSEA